MNVGVTQRSDNMRADKLMIRLKNGDNITEESIGLKIYTLTKTMNI